MTKSTKEPIKIKPNRKRQADEEFKLIKGLTESIAEKRNKRQTSENQSAGPDDAFGRYILQTLSELDKDVKHLVQYRINDILFQAQTGELTKNQSMGTRAPIPAQQHAFLPVHPQYNMPPFGNQMGGINAFNPNAQATGNMLSTPNQLPMTTDSNSSQGHAMWFNSNPTQGASFEN